jgi:hypothetical protein
VLIDCQKHVFPPEYVALLARNPHPTQASATGEGGFAITYRDGERVVQQFRVTHAMYDPANKLRDMDRCGIDVALLSVNMPGPYVLADDLSPTATASWPRRRIYTAGRMKGR